MLNNKNNKVDHDFLILFESISRPITRQNVSTTFCYSKYEVPGHLIKEITSRIKSIKRHSKKEGFEFFDDRIARLDDWHFSNGDVEMLTLHFSETSYYYFAAMNLRLDEPVATIDNNKGYYHGKGKQPTLRDLLKERSKYLRNSKLPNPLSANMSVVLTSSLSKSESESSLKSKLILSKRSRSYTLEAQGNLSCLIGGTISIKEGDIDSAGNPDPFKTVIREAKEELSLNLDDFNSNIIFYGLGRNLSNLKPELYGEVLLYDITEKEFNQAWNNAKDKEESQELIFEDIAASHIRTMIKESYWSPVGRTATIASLRHRSIY